MRTCILCRERPAEVPDRDAQGRAIKVVCRVCHGKRLQEDLRRIMELPGQRSRLAKKAVLN